MADASSPFQQSLAQYALQQQQQNAMLSGLLAPQAASLPDVGAPPINLGPQDWRPIGQAGDAARAAISGIASIPEQAIRGSEEDLGTMGSGAPMASVGPATDAVMLTIGAGSPFAAEDALGAAGGRLAAVRHPLTGKLQVAPQQKLADMFVDGSGGVQTTPRAPLRGAGGKFSTTADYFRGRVPIEEERTALQANPMYDPANPPPPVASRLETPNPQDPAAVQRNLSRIPNSFFSAPVNPADPLSPTSAQYLDYLSKVQPQ
jgi:hypothetical protein